MSLTASQLATLKADVSANVNTIPAGQTWTGAFAGVQVKNVSSTSDGNTAVAGWYNQTASPAFTVWRTNISTQEINEAVDWSEVTALTTNNLISFQILKDQDRLDGANTSIRAAFNAIFPSASKPNTNAALLALAKRNATSAEKLFASGTGSTASPATMGFEGNLTLSDVETARNLP